MALSQPLGGSGSEGGEPFDHRVGCDMVFRFEFGVVEGLQPLDAIRIECQRGAVARGGGLGFAQTHQGVTELCFDIGGKRRGAGKLVAEGKRFCAATTQGKGLDAIKPQATRTHAGAALVGLGNALRVVCQRRVEGGVAVRRPARRQRLARGADLPRPGFRGVFLGGGLCARLRGCRCRCRCRCGYGREFKAASVIGRVRSTLQQDPVRPDGKWPVTAEPRRSGKGGEHVFGQARHVETLCRGQCLLMLLRPAQHRHEVEAIARDPRLRADQSLECRHRSGEIACTRRADRGRMHLGGRRVGGDRRPGQQGEGQCDAAGYLGELEVHCCRHGGFRRFRCAPRGHDCGSVGRFLSMTSASTSTISRCVSESAMLQLRRRPGV